MNTSWRGCYLFSFITKNIFYVYGIKTNAHKQVMNNATITVRSICLKTLNIVNVPKNMIIKQYDQ